MKEPVFKGACTAMITPFGADGIDFARLEQQLEFQSLHGTAAVVIAGTTGEAATLSQQEFESLVAFAVRKSAGRMKVIACVGGNDTEKCRMKAQFADVAGADAVLMTAPYYNKTSAAGLTEHFLSVADHVGIPLILYNVPSRTAIGIPYEVYQTLAEHPNVNGVKEASGDFSLIARLAASFPGQLHLWSGNDDHTIAMMALGALGVISVASNLLPETVAALCDACLRGDYASANALYADCAEVFRMLFVETNPIPVKAAMQLHGMDSGILRPPLVPLSEEHLAALESCLLQSVHFR